MPLAALLFGACAADRVPIGRNAEPSLRVDVLVRESSYDRHRERYAPPELARPDLAELVEERLADAGAEAGASLDDLSFGDGARDGGRDAAPSGGSR